MPRIETRRRRHGNRIDWSNHASCNDPVDPPDALTPRLVDESTDLLRGLELLTNDLAETRAFDLRKTEKLLREIRASAKRRVDLSRKPGILHIVANASIVHSASRLLYQCNRDPIWDVGRG
jgi:hypothetical protein